MSSLPPDALQALQQLLLSLTSPDNSIRSAAEKSLYDDWVDGQAQHVEMLLLGLAEQSCGGDESIRSFSAVLLRRIACRQPASSQTSSARIIDTVSPPVLATIKSVLLQGFVAPQPADVRHKISDAIAEIARPEYTSTEWPELLTVIFQASKNPDAQIRESAFRVFGAIPTIIGENLIQSVVPVFAEAFQDSSEAVRISAVTAFTSFFETLPKSTWPTLQAILPNLLSVLQPLGTPDKSTELTSVLESLVELTELAPKMFRNVFKDILDFCMSVAKNKEMDDNARMTALELITTFADEAPTMCKKEPTYANELALQCLLMMTEIGEDDDDAAEWQNEDDVFASEDQDEIYGAAKQSLDRICLKLGGKVMVPPLFHWLVNLIKSSEWRERHAALIAISNAVEGCRDILLPELDKLLDMVIPSLNDNHCRVQWAACNALGQMSTDFAPEIQATCGNRILPALIEKLGNDSTPRVQAHAAAALVNFSENATKEMLDPFLDSLLNGLLILLRSPKRYVQEQCVTTIAIVADAAESLFIKYYDTLMSLLFNVMKSDTGKEYRLLKAKSIECASLIAQAVGKENFMPQCEEMAQTFASIQNSITDEDDPSLHYLVHGWGRLCHILGSDFKPYLPLVMPQLLETAAHKPDLKLFENEGDVDQIDERDGWEIIPLQGKYLGIHSALLDEKSGAIDLISVYATELGADFAPYVKNIIETIIAPSLDFFYHDGVRYAAAQAAPHLLYCLQQAIARETNDAANAKDDPHVLELWVLILKKILYVLKVDTLVETVTAMYSCLSRCIELIGSPKVMPPKDIEEFVAAAILNLEDLTKRVEARHVGENDAYREEIEEDDAEEADEDLMAEINRAIHSIFQTCREACLPAFEPLLRLISKFLTSNSVNCRQFALCAFDDMLEHLGPYSWNYHELFLPKMIDALLDADASVRQTAAYGIGVAAQYGGDSYIQATAETLQTLFNVARVPDARSEENVQATENACAAIAKILHKNGSYLGASLDAAIEEWISTLPVVADEEAAAFVYHFLCHLMEHQHPAVIAKADRVFDSVIQALAANSIQGKTRDRTIETTKQLLSQFGQERALELFQKLPAESQQVAQTYF